MKRLILILVMALVLSPPLHAQAIDDRALANRVSSTIAASEELNGSDILVVSVNGYVILTGQALSAAQKQQASVAVAFASNNMRRLINEVVVVDALDNSFEASDRALLDQIMAMLPGMSPTTVPVIHNGVVHLLGQVTREEGTEVANAISRMPGVKNIRLSFEYIQQ